MLPVNKARLEVAVYQRDNVLSGRAQNGNGR